jgi:GntR family transcriptional regulator
MYRRIADDLRDKIESGVLGHGSQLPTELKLRERYDASRNTVREAVRWLMNRGLVETRPGHGTFVVEKIHPFVTQLTGRPDRGRDVEGPVYSTEASLPHRTPVATEPRVEIQQASSMIRHELRLTDNATVVSRHQQRSIDGARWSLQTSFYPMGLVERGALRLIQTPDIDEGAVAYLGASLGLRQAGYRDTITVRSPDSNEALFFSLPSDGRVMVFEVLRTAFDDLGQPFRLTVSVYPTDRNQFSVSVGEVPGEAEPASRNTANSRLFKEKSWLIPCTGG